MAGGNEEREEQGHSAAFSREYAYVEKAYATLEKLRARIERSMRQALELPRGGTPQARLERDVTIEASLARLARLEVGGAPTFVWSDRSR